MIAKHLAALGWALPDPPEPRGLYSPIQQHAGLVYVSGQLSRSAEGIIQGPATPETDPTTYAAAGKACLARALAAVQQSIDLDCLERPIFLRGYVFASASFTRHSAVLDHVSGPLAQLFPGLPPPARSAIGVASLPDGGLLEIEVIFALRT
ncbi:RidA family protein [Sphingomonas abietis]|uniref:RidA family protein n=1 Tax=Sphingomonas abietis TaxID=3012344 RepID=A0ABY7NLG6_9SPHN|nr:RidA family protein [Sphingomonas abietis]WBO21815.1 RidA family protein [Sphingomonas abietis]